MHGIFSSPRPLEDLNDKPISVQKAKARRWPAEKKKILGWLFQGVMPTQPTSGKSKTMIAMLTQLTWKNTVHFRQLEKMNGKLMHATIGILNGHDLPPLLIARLAKQPKT